MAVTVVLRPEIEAKLAAQARARGVPMEVYLQELIEDLIGINTETPTGPEEVTTALNALAEMGRTLPHLPSSAFSRESIYQDHN